MRTKHPLSVDLRIFKILYLKRSGLGGHNPLLLSAGISPILGDGDDVFWFGWPAVVRQPAADYDRHKPYQEGKDDVWLSIAWNSK